MAVNKKMILRIGLLIELLLAMLILSTGKQGFKALQQAYIQQECLEKDMCHLQQEVIQLQHELDQYTNNDLYKEKIAREDLHMARLDERVYMY